MAKRKKTKRSQEKYPALKKNLNLKTRYEQSDYDYIDALKKQAMSKDKVKAKEARDALKFLNDFTEGYINADFRKPATKKMFEGRYDLVKESYNRNNARNRCQLTRARAYGATESYEDIIENLDEEITSEFTEDELIEGLDNLENGEAADNETD